MVGDVGLKPTASWSQTTRAINCANPRNMWASYKSIHSTGTTVF